MFKPGRFSQPENAQKARTRLASMGAVEVTNMRVKGSSCTGPVGPVHSTAEADRLVSRLSGTGYPDARVVTE
jgi:Fe2+ transport system protein FeoA